MEILGEKIFAKDEKGQLLSRIGTMFFRTSGLVTLKGVHALQRVMWLDHLRARAPLSPEAEEAEIAESVDLIFTEELVLIRPNPDRMDLAFRADEELQKLVSKRVIRFLNTNSAKVRRALCERGENWRMAREPLSQEDMAEFIRRAKVPIEERPIYYYNRTSGTRFLTASSYDEVAALDDEAFRRQVAEIVRGLNNRNRHGYPEIDLFPTTTPIEIRKTFKALKVDELSGTQLRMTCDRLAQDWRMTIPAQLREETIDNFEWRNTMCYTLSRGPHETAAEEQELIAGIAPEFYRQIEWLPGARIDRGEVIFDAIYNEAARTQDPELIALCDNRVKGLIFNATRVYGAIDYLNIGRIAKSLARHPVAGSRRGNVYIVQYRERGASVPSVRMIRLQKWGVAERLDEGKDLLQAILETNEYSDYILDRRLMCRQLGMNLPRQLTLGDFTEKYRGHNQYNGVAVRATYFVRDYIPGVASDKIPPAKFHHPAFALRFAELMGAAAAIDLVVGRRSSLTNESLFDQNYEVLRLDGEGMPAELIVTDHAGSFVDYERDYLEYVAEYAAPVRRRRELVTDYAGFAATYCRSFERQLVELKTAYSQRRRAFDELFADRPYDTNGSGAYRWARALARLNDADPARVAASLMKAIGC